MKKVFHLFIFVATLCAVLFFIGHSMISLTSGDSISKNASHYRYLFMLWRYGLYALILILWPYFVACIGKKQKWNAETIHYFSNQRIKLFVLFLIFEIFFVFNVISHLL
ncbi:MAG: hypothetical protein COY58_00400 [Gammaproteobacteria bacterium CG_4_10_14_0_8_um_filter_38_16]|nr:MAG: hypothetical protein COY58_00400 [Gammaproteobacteria bacterium CG_4_10_14_0_8_um_filter_38_16]PJA04218.1 MAG: hypothetical protein COX72_01200 [Gammaproteobacteria bacterium CG_4_10_14_0_2_um_filter_38_22]PJB11053.1 MAG: hypothetical protein CO120_01700 [Gammaproteobacteria bacterium CG_4_9_14_3_um_filter_38_9]